MKYAYEDLSDTQFETLVVFICQKLFGISVQAFSKGPDGGRDARFSGTASIYPSPNSLWTGITIIQAKHTNGYNKLFSEPDFFSEASTTNVIGKEIPRIRNLRQNMELDNYILFSNRRLAGNAESSIRSFISKQCNIPINSIALCGIEQIEIWLRTFPDIATNADIDPIDSPLIISPDAISNIVEAMSKVKDSITQFFDKAPTPRMSYEDKNELNKMSETYAKEQRKKYLKDTKQIQNFLADPANIDLLHQYEEIVEELNFKIIAKRKDYQTFDQVMEYLLELLYNRDPILRSQKRLTRAFLFYMYWNCDIGEVDYA